MAWYAVAMNRKQRRKIAEQTLAVLSDATYTAPSGNAVDFGAELRAAVAQTGLYTPESRPPSAAPTERATLIQLANETTLAGARTCFDEHGSAAALNFASAWNPGGGFQTGAEAQEESLARASGLFPCLDGSPFYAFHRQQDDRRYSDRAIHSPCVPVFRDDSGALLETPWPCSFVTSPAVDRRRFPESENTDALMAQRIRFVLDVFAAHTHENIVLGAWGCGVFQNEPATIASQFADALATTHRGVFRVVRFSVFDRRDDGTLRAFAERFGEAAVSGE